MKGFKRHWLWLLIVGAVLANELRKPADVRTWHDHLFGFLPYDFRRPTWERFTRTVWNPTNEHILVPQLFGIGWTVNLYALLKRVGMLPGTQPIRSLDSTT